MIIYTIDMYNKETESLILEIEISSERINEIIDILKLNGKDH